MAESEVVNEEETARADAPADGDALEQAVEAAKVDRGPKKDAWTGVVVRSHRGPLERKLARTMMRTVQEWNLIEEGDRIMVCLSGGKDSYTLFDLLVEAQRRAPFPFEIVGVHLDQAQPGYDGKAFSDWLEARGAPYEILREDTFSIVKEATRPGQAYCFICSRLRRGILYAAADRLGCNKLALGHHRDDALETLLMNLFWAGRMQAMPATYTTDDEKFQVIRPLIDCAESDIAKFAEQRAYPIIPCNLCGTQEGLKRGYIKELLQKLEGDIHDIRPVMARAMKNVRPSHLLDKDLGEVWDQRPDDIRPWHVKDEGEEEKATSCSDERPRLGDKDNVVKRGHLTVLPS